MHNEEQEEYSAVDELLPTEEEELETVEEEAEEVVEDDVDWLEIARTAYQDSTDFLDAGMRRRWKRNYSLANSKHPDGSKYHSPAYKNRSKTFRGKTAASIRQNEAACAVALFSTTDAVSIEARNQDDPAQVEATNAIKELVNERLENDIPWFQTVQAAYKDGMIIGSVISKQYWMFEEEVVGDGLLTPQTRNKLTDKPVIDLLPIENVRVSPSAHWIDPINSSPFVIIMHPMYVGDVKMRKDWVQYPDDMIQSSVKTGDDNEALRRERDKAARQDPKSTEVSSITDHDIVWVHEVFMRHEGVEYVYFTLGTELALSEVMLLTDAYPHCIDGKRPVIFGSTEISPHSVYAQGLPARVEGSQTQANNIANQRFDNIEQVLNRRKYARRARNIDYRALKTNAPGVVVEMDDTGDVVPEPVLDITGSAYQEQNLVNLDFDEDSGGFSSSTVSSNRQLNETVGGMQMLSGNANTLTEYQLRIFVETWVEPVVRQLVSMVQGYEDDETIQAVTNKQITSDMLRTPVKCRVSAGFGATDPARKVQKLMMGLETIGKINPRVIQEADFGEIASEVFGALGFRDGLRFFPALKKKEGGEQQEDPKLQQMQQQMQQMQQYIETKQAEAEAKVAIADKNNQTKLQVEQLKAQSKGEQILAESYAERELALDKLAIEEGLKREEMEQRAGVDSDKLTLDSVKEMNRQADIMNNTAELKYKIKTGNQGI